MLAGSVLQKMVNDINQIINEDCSVWSTDAKCLVSTTEEMKGVEVDVKNILSQADDKSIQVTERTAAFVIRHEEEIMYIFVIHHVMDNIAIMGKLCVNQFENVISLYEKRVDRNQFFQQLLLDNLLLVEINKQAKKVNVEVQARRIVFVIEQKKKGKSLLLETMKGIYDVGSKDVVTSVDESHVILVKTLSDTDEYLEINEIANTIVDTLSAEAMVQVRVAYGSIVNELKDVSKCYKEACLALDVGRIFYVQKEVLAYNELGIGRLIHQLPYSLCEMFLKEVFQGNAIEQFDKETLATVNAFFEHDLNISETARNMYLHRNTLGYRLDKIQKTTGLDVKKFEDALTFKIALMVSDHMRFIQSQE